MDTTKKYVEMCREAEELQENWKPGIGRYFNSCMGGVCIYTGRLHTSGWTYEIICENDIEGRQIWLPRQDELQGMLVNWGVPAKLFVFGIPAIGYDENDPMQATSEGLYYLHSDFNSWEQLWLAFVMKEKYQRVWNGKNWEE